ncbi:hypothetical protein F0P96_03065 [Hymenobacter busanensis]|uniref:Uncharacterized protein n=1 Tax=Hymenobacter busanensis TaxID=2607656 RepID=A0A7L4ZUG6_9BACT|nr:hypothetical protein [Hymenobacter busanensis]KAA9339608.1 hypothetical protein F0P96_03065 [Hymenobacter busanensis]QHJ06637.1 hypothetical protein GUY19_04690 [Hymenobacter busanensis]
MLRRLFFRCMLLGALPGTLTGCFDLREPEPAGAPGEWVQPTSVDVLITNFVTAVQRMNPANYERCFAPQYRFYPDPAAAGSTSAALFANWGVREELDYFNSLKRHSPGAGQNQLLLTARRDQLFTTDSAEVSAQYQLTLAQQDTAFRYKVLEGNIRLLLRRRNNEWQVAAWRDLATSGKPVWTEAKKYFIRN